MPKFTTLVGLELSKMFHKKRIVFGIGFMILIFTIMAYGSSRTYDNHWESQWHEENLRHNIEYLENQINDPNLPKEVKEDLQKEVDFMKYELEVGFEKAREVRLNRELEEAKESLANPDTPSENIPFLQKRIEVIEAQLEHGDSSHQVQKLHYEERLESVTLELTKDNSPEELSKLKSQEKELKLKIAATQPDNQFNSFFLLTMFFSTVGSLLLPLVIVLVASETISGEYSLGTIKLLLIKPFTRVKLYLSKYTALMIYGLFVFAVVSIIGYIIGGFFVGFGGANLTRVVGMEFTGNNMSGWFHDYSGAFLVTNFQYILIMLGLFLVLLTAIVAFSMLISVFTKSATISLVATMGLVIFGNILSALMRNFSASKYLLTTHINILNYLEGGLVVPGITLTFSVVVILVYTAICLVAGVYSFKRKDIV
ncbi:ABC transporter permease subunit [Alkalicella caledoniensis]|uniref:ABC transporter permease subunit n=1 Tax=Alkalicella caledoniensis TaxID=2731377 RepID=A0A7G9WB89_ALKCA|nr:ABC transporter permease [Alkalicella caledoniensis]QNO15951.1 ABC transporter permease subunit [Alkalicella caledoniensis]